MILVDTSVWVDYLRGTITTASDRLHELIGSGDVVVGDLILVETLQGVLNDAEFKRTMNRLLVLPIVHIGGRIVAVQAARNYRELRSLGITIRKTIDTLIATRCILSGYELLYSDRDFDPFVKHLGLRAVL